MKVSTIVSMASIATKRATVERSGDFASIRFGSATISLDMETLRDLCNDIAEVLDGWFDERDRSGK